MPQQTFQRLDESPGLQSVGLKVMLEQALCNKSPSASLLDSVNLISACPRHLLPHPL